MCDLNNLIWGMTVDQDETNHNAQLELISASCVLNKAWKVAIGLPFPKTTPNFDPTYSSIEFLSICTFACENKC